MVCILLAFAQPRQQPDTILWQGSYKISKIWYGTRLVHTQALERIYRLVHRINLSLG